MHSKRTYHRILLVLIGLAVIMAILVYAYYARKLDRLQQDMQRIGYHQTHHQK